MSTVSSRVRILGAKLVCLALLIVGGILPIVAFSTFVLPMETAVHESHGMVGFIYGLLFMLGTFVASVAAWVATGRGLFYRLMLE